MVARQIPDPTRSLLKVGRSNRPRVKTILFLLRLCNPFLPVCCISLFHTFFWGVPHRAFVAKRLSQTHAIDPFILILLHSTPWHHCQLAGRSHITHAHVLLVWEDALKIFPILGGTPFSCDGLDVGFFLLP
jgi:hypothetical protein